MSCEPKTAAERRAAEEAARHALEDGYTCAESYELGSCDDAIQAAAARVRAKQPEKYLGYIPSTTPGVTSDEKREDRRPTTFPPGTIETYTGDVYDFQNPDPESIHFEDIAHALAMACRFAGHVRRFYSVAEHSVRASQLLEIQGYSVVAQLAALFHDAHEAYVWDAPRPIKPLLGPQFGLMADKADSAIARALSDWTTFRIYPADFKRPQIKLADNMMLVYERKQLMTAGPDQWEPGYEDVPDLPPKLRGPLGWSPSVAEHQFHRRAKELGL